MPREMRDIPTNVSFGTLSDYGLRAEDIYIQLLRHGQESPDARIAAALVEHAERIEAQVAIRTHRPAKAGWKAPEVLIGAQIAVEVADMPGTWLLSAPIVLQRDGKWKMQERLVRRNTSHGVTQSRGETRSVAALGTAWPLANSQMMFAGYSNPKFDKDERDILEAASGRNDAVLLARRPRKSESKPPALPVANDAEKPLFNEKRSISARGDIAVPGVSGSLELRRDYEIVRVKLE